MDADAELARSLRAATAEWQAGVYAFVPFARALLHHAETLRRAGRSRASFAGAADAAEVEATLCEARTLLALWGRGRLPTRVLEKRLAMAISALGPDDRAVEALAYALRLAPEDPPEWAERLASLHVLRQTVLAMRNELVERHLALARRLARRYSGRGVGLADLEQEASLGLLRAVEKFEPDRGVPLASYARWWIRHGLIRAVQGQGRDVRLPVHVHELLARASRLERRLRAHGVSLPLEERARALGVPPERLAGIELARGPMLSMEQPQAGDEAPALGEQLAGARPQLDVVLDHDRLGPVLRRWIGELPARERAIVSNRFGFDADEPATLEELGARLGLSSERVRQLEARALERLRRLAKARDVHRPLGEVDEPGDGWGPA